MKELEQILHNHAAAYPKMEPTDAVKLIYQNEFGGGHLVRDRAAALGYLRREYASVSRDPTQPLWEEIGNGLCRVHLAALAEADLEAMGEAFIASAAEHGGTLPRFLEKLDLLRSLAARGIFAFGESELEAYLTQYAAAGYPMVSHSEAYRRAYRPAYRVILKKYRK